MPTIEEDLYLASSTGDHKKVVALLDQGANPNHRAPGASLPLFVAAYKGHLEVVKVLLKVGAKLEFEGLQDILSYIINSKETTPAVIDLLIKSGADVKKVFLNSVVKLGNIEIMKLFLAAGIDIEKENSNNSGLNALCIAIELANEEAAQLLIDSKINLNIKLDKSIYLGPPSYANYVSKITILQYATDHLQSLIDIYQHALKQYEISKGTSSAQYNPAPDAKSLESKIDRIGRIVQLLLKAGANPHSGINFKMVLKPEYPSSQYPSETLRNILKKCEGICQLINQFVNADLQVKLLSAIEQRDEKIIDNLVAQGAANFQDTQGDTLLHLLVKRRRVDFLRFILKVKGINIEIKDASEATALHLAASLDQAEAVEILITAGANIEARDNLKLTPLTWAARTGAIAALKKLLSHQADKEARDESGLRPIHWAIKEGRRDIVNALIEFKVDITAESEKGDISLHDAIKYSRWEIAKLLIVRFVADKLSLQIRDHQGRTPLHWAAEMGNLEITQQLVEHNVNLDVSDFAKKTPYQLALAKNPHQVANFILDWKDKAAQQKTKNASLTEGLSQDISQLQQSFKLLTEKLTSEIESLTRKNHQLEKANAEMLPQLFEAKKTITELQATKNTQQLQIDEYQQSILEQNKKIASLENQFKRGFSFESLLWSAAKNGELKQLNTLIKLDVDIEIIDENGLTLLHWAAFYGHSSIASALLNKAPQLLNRQDNQGNTPLHWAAMKNNLSIMITLLHQKSSLNLLNQENKTAYELASSKEIQQAIANQMLFNAAKTGNIEEAQKAIKLGADINAMDTCNNCKETALHKASYYKHKELVSFLINHGAEVNAKDHYDRTPSEVISDIATQKAIRYAKFLTVVKEGDINTINVMSADGLDINAPRNEFGATALHIAINSFTSVKMINTLINLGAQVNAVDQKNQTPLHIAAERGNQEVVNLLLVSKADIRAKDFEGNTPPQLAHKKGYHELAFVMYEYAINKPSAPQSSGYAKPFFPGSESQKDNSTTATSQQLEKNKMEEQRNSTIQLN